MEEINSRFSDNISLLAKAKAGDRDAMAEMMKKPILGIVENMSVFKCPDCGKEHRIFGGKGSSEIAAAHGIAASASLPIDPAFAAAVDSGTIETVDTSALKAVVDAVLG